MGVWGDRNQMPINGFDFMLLCQSGDEWASIWITRKTFWRGRTRETDGSNLFVTLFRRRKKSEWVGECVAEQSVQGNRLMDLLLAQRVTHIQHTWALREDEMLSFHYRYQLHRNDLLARERIRCTGILVPSPGNKEGRKLAVISWTHFFVRTIMSLLLLIQSRQLIRYTTSDADDCLANIRMQ